MMILSLRRMLFSFVVVVGIAITIVVVFVCVVWRSFTTIGRNCTTSTSGKGSPLTFCPCIHCYIHRCYHHVYTNIYTHTRNSLLKRRVTTRRKGRRVMKYRIYVRRCFEYIYIYKAQFHHHRHTILTTTTTTTTTSKKKQYSLFLAFFLSYQLYTSS